MAKLFSKSHEWVDMINPSTAIIGLTDYAQKELGGLVFINLPQEGDKITAGEPFADVESVKAVSDVIAPVTGMITEVNFKLLDSPESINEAPYKSWLVKVQGISEKEELLTEEEYSEYIAGLKK